MIKVAITGNIAAGKSEVEKFIKESGFKVLCADSLTHDIYDNDENVREKIYKTFKTCDRKKIAQIVFSTPELRVELEKIMHPEIKREVEKFFDKNSKEKALFVSVPLLYEVGWEKMFDKVILVTAPDEIRLERLIKRNDFTKEEALKRIEVQVPQEEKVSKSDFVIENKGSLEDLKTQTLKTIESLGLRG